MMHSFKHKILSLCLPVLAFMGITPAATAATDPEFIVTFAADTLDEGYPAVYSSLFISLAEIPADTVYIIADPGTQCNINGGWMITDTLMFTPFAAALIPQEIKVKPWNDTDVEGLHLGVVSFTVSSDDPVFDEGMIDAVWYVIEDNDFDPGVVVDFVLDTILQEGLAGVDLKFRLLTIPDDTVYITADPDLQLRITATPGEAAVAIFYPNPSALNFTGFPVRAVDDAVYEGPHAGTIEFSVSSDDADYNAFVITPLTYSILDNEPFPSVLTDIPVDTFLTEGLAGFNVLYALSTQPQDTVFITLDPDDQLRVTAIPGEAITLIFPPDATALSFDGANLRAADDFIYEGPHSGTINISIFSDDPFYNALSLDPLIYAIVDNDNPPGLTVTPPASFELTEGLTEIALVTIALESVPSDTVYIHVQPDLQLRITEPGVAYTMVFPPNTTALNDHFANIKVYDDIVYEETHSGMVTYSIETTDPDYTGMLIDPMEFTIYDNEILPAIIFSDTSGFSGTEGDSILSFSIRFNSIPVSTMTITLQPDLNLDLGKGPGDELKLKFRSDSALVDQWVNVYISDDHLVEGLHTGVITFAMTGTDPYYAAMSIPDLRVSIIDNDINTIAEYDAEMFSAWPVPATEFVAYRLAQFGDIQVYNALGILIREEKNVLQGQLSIQDWPPGSYYLLARCGAGTYRMTIIRS